MSALSRAGQLLLGVAVVGAVAPSCYSAGAGTAPPPNTFYFPVGLAVSADGLVLYAANSDFDLQWNGGTLQSYDLQTIRADAVALIQANVSAQSPTCISSPPGGGVSLGQGCAPPRSASPSTNISYLRQSVIIGAFATDLQLSIQPDPSVPQRIFVPVRGEAAVTWAEVGIDADPKHEDPFAIFCGQGSDGRCGADHRTGSDPNQPGNTRHVTMPGEPFGMAQSEDGTALAVTSQTDTKTSLLTTGLLSSGGAVADPTMQFVLDGLPVGGVGIAAVPHDPDASVKRCEDVGYVAPCVRPAFLETNRNTAELDLLRYYNDDGSTLSRPFLQREAVFPITSNAVGTDSRGIVMDPTPRVACKALGNDPAACAQLPARVFFSSRTPPALGMGLIGGYPPSGIGPYDPDLLVLLPPVSLQPGPSNVYIAPIVDRNGALALRVFVVLFDSSQVVVYDPEAPGIIETVINVGPGPFAMAFDPFSLDDVARHRSIYAPDASGNLPVPYRFAYVASFTESYVQMIDLDNSQPNAETFERVVYTLGQPTLPKGQ